MRARFLLWLGLTACQSEAILWLPPPVEGAVSFVLMQTERGGFEVVGRHGPDGERLSWSEAPDSARILALSLDVEALRRLSPRLDESRWSASRLELIAEGCKRRALSDDLESRPLPSATRTFELDPERSGWRPVDLPPELHLATSLVLPTDPTRCGGRAPVLRPFGAEPMVLLDGFEARGTTHDAQNREHEGSIFRLHHALATSHGAVLAASNQYLYFLTAGRSIEIARPREVLTAPEVSGLPGGVWSFGQIVPIPGRDSEYLVAMHGADSPEVAGVVAAIETSSAGILRASVLGTTRGPLDAIAITESGQFIAVGDRGSVVVGDAREGRLRATGLLMNVSLKLVAATGRTDYPFVVSDSTGALALVSPERGEVLDLAGDAFGSTTIALLASAGPPSRVEALRYNAELLTVIGNAAPIASVIPMASSIARCASAGDACDPHLLGQGPGSFIELAPRQLVFAPRQCTQLAERRAEQDCSVGWSAEPEAPNHLGFAGFETLDYRHGRLTAAGRGGVLYQAAVE